jgi:hypothetical protein
MRGAEPRSLQTLLRPCFGRTRSSNLLNLKHATFNLHVSAARDEINLMLVDGYTCADIIAPLGDIAVADLTII